MRSRSPTVYALEGRRAMPLACYMCVCVRMHVCMCVCVYVYVCVCMYKCAAGHGLCMPSKVAKQCLLPFMYVCIYLYIYIYIYIYVYIYIVCVFMDNRNTYIPCATHRDLPIVPIKPI